MLYDPVKTLVDGVQVTEKTYLRFGGAKLSPDHHVCVLSVSSKYGQVLFEHVEETQDGPTRITGQPAVQNHHVRHQDGVQPGQFTHTVPSAQKEGSR